MTQTTEIYACLFAKEFPAQALLRLRPDLHPKPCVVLEGEAPTQHVCSLNTKARLLGMERGITHVEVDTFPETVVFSRSPQSETATKAVLLECAGAFSPRVEDRSEANAFLCGIDIAGTKNLFGPPEMLARNLLQRVRALGISASVTVSTNLNAAVSLAKGLSRKTPLHVIPAGREAATLSVLPLSVLDLTEKQTETFGLWGIHTLGMLAALPEKELVARMGQEGRRLRQLAQGELPHLFQPVEPIFTLEERAELNSPVEILESLLFGLAVMLEQLILRAKARILSLASVTVTLALDGGGTHTRTVRPALPTTDKQLWIKLLHLDLEAHPPSAAIVGVMLHAEPGSTTKMQLGLFSPQLPEASRLDVTLARIRAVVGEDCVGCHTSAKRNDIRAHVGAEVAVSSLGSRLTPPAWLPHQHLPEPARVSLLCESREGYQNLCQLITRFKMREKTKQEGSANLIDLQQYAKGLVCLTGGDEGPLTAALMRGGEEAGREVVETLIRIYGPQNVYVELQRHGEREQEWRNQAAIRIAASLRLPLLATNGVRYATADDREILDLFTCVRNHTELDKAGRLLSVNNQRHLRSAQEMTTLFRDVRRATENSVELASRLQFELSDLCYEFPRYQCRTAKRWTAFYESVWTRVLFAVMDQSATQGCWTVRGSKWRMSWS